MKLEALFDAVIVQPLEEEDSQYGGIVVPDLGNEKNKKGTIIAVGPGKPTVAGKFIHTQVKKGDIIILPTMGFTKLDHDGDEYWVGPENQILARVKKEEEEENLLLF